MNDQIVTEHRVEQDVVGDQVVQRESVNAVPARDVRTANKTIQIVYYIEGLIMALLGLRFVLRLLGASVASPFVSFIYTITYPFVYPFFGMFRSVWGYGAARLEFETLVGMAVYAILTWIIVGLFRLRK
jgi:YggT family protein